MQWRSPSGDGYRWEVVESELDRRRLLCCVLRMSDLRSGIPFKSDAARARRDRVSRTLPLAEDASLSLTPAQTAEHIHLPSFHYILNGRTWFEQEAAHSLGSLW